MDEHKRAGFQRLVRASLLIEEASTASTRAAENAERTRASIARIAQSVRELHRLVALEGTASTAAVTLAGLLLAETTRARAGLELMHSSVRKSSECTQEASTLIKVA